MSHDSEFGSRDSGLKGFLRSKVVKWQVFGFYHASCNPPAEMLGRGPGLRPRLSATQSSQTASLRYKLGHYFVDYLRPIKRRGMLPSGDFGGYCSREPNR